MLIGVAARPRLAVLTGGGDRPYALGLATALIAEGVTFDFIGSDDLESPELRAAPGVRVLNLRGDMRPDAPAWRKLFRVATYYVRLLRYAATSPAPVFHLLWNNKFEYVDRTLLFAFYRLLGKRLALTVHNVNIRKRDGNDTWLNRLTLRFQYRMADHLFVHTPRMAQELQREFAVPMAKISVIPFGINSTVPNTALSAEDARERLGIGEHEKVVLFFGNIARYKGLDLLVEALPLLLVRMPEIRMVIAGRPKGEDLYWASIDRRITELRLCERVTRRIEYVPDAETEVFFKAADLLVLPYTQVFQSGVLFLGYNFGLPAVAADVGALRDEIVEGETGYVCAPHSAQAIADAIHRYFRSDLYSNLAARREGIRCHAAERYSWSKVAAVSATVYRNLSLTSDFDGAHAR